MQNKSVSVNIKTTSNENINSITSMYIGEQSVFKNKEINMPLTGPTIINKSTIQNGNIIVPTGYIDNNEFVDDGYIFSNNGNQWYYNNKRDINYKTFANINNFTKIKYINGYYYGVDESTILYRSKDLLYWENITPSTFAVNYQVQDIIYDGNEFMVLTRNGDNVNIYASTNGDNWYLKTNFITNSNQYVNSIIYGNGYYYIYSNSNMSYLYYSTDCINFIANTNYLGYVKLEFGYLNNYGNGFIMMITDSIQSSFEYYKFININNITQINLPARIYDSEFSISGDGELLIIGLYNFTFRVPSLLIYTDLSTMEYTLIDISNDTFEECVFSYKLNGIIYIGLLKYNQFTIFNYDYNTVKENYVVYDLTSGNYNNGSIEHNHLGYSIGNEYNNIILTPYSDSQQNSNGNYDYYSNIEIKAVSSINKIVISFGNDGVFPTKIYVNGDLYTNNSSMAILELDYNLLNNATIEFEDLNLPNSQVKIGSLTSIVNLMFGRNNGLTQVSTEGVSDSLPYYGIISYSGSVSIIDKDEMLQLFNDLGLLYDVAVNIYKNNTLCYTFYSNNEIEINNVTKEFTINLIDNIESLQDYKTTFPLYFPNMSGYQLFQELCSKFGYPVILAQDVYQLLQNIYIENVLIESDSWWNIWQSFCIGTKSIFLKSPSGDYIIKGA